MNQMNNIKKEIQQIKNIVKKINFSMGSILIQMNDEPAPVSVCDQYANMINNIKLINIDHMNEGGQYLQKLIKIKLNPMTRAPVAKWKDAPKNTTTDTIKGTYGILTGEKNNIFVLDVDDHDEKNDILNGVDEMIKYYNKYSNINTLTVKTPTRRGYHLYFSYPSINDPNYYNIKNYLYTCTGLRGAGLDIRADGGYIVGPGSYNKGKPYDIINNIQPSQMPESLINFLIEPSKKNNNIKNDIKCILKKDINLNFKNEYKFNVTDDDAKNIISLLGPNYYNNYSEWLKIATIYKNLNKYDICDEWSKQSKKYDKIKNDERLKSLNCQIDINYIVNILNNTREHKIKYFEKMKIYEPITSNIDNIKKININSQYLFNDINNNSFNYKIYSKYDTIIIKSSTGTGKTTAISKLLNIHLLEDPEIKFITITDKITLSDQHAKSFNNMNHYKYNSITTQNQKATICINSLKKISSMSDDDIEKTIFYIDEIASFINFTHNTTLYHDILTIYIFLMRIIKKAKKIIVSDAMINDGVFEFLKFRPDDKKIFITNTFKRFQDVAAVRMHNEYEFIDQLKMASKIGGFFCASDSCNSITKLYNECIKDDPDNLEKYILITSNTTFTVTDASAQFLNKCVFASPKITTGLDITFSHFQDVYIYSKGETIDPSMIYQQTTRTRNIKTLYYYINDKQKRAKYDNIDVLKTELKQNIKTCSALIDICQAVTEDEELLFIENIFFNLYSYNEYIKDIYDTNHKEHYETILNVEGFKISNMGDKIKLTVPDKKEQTINMMNISETLLNNFLESSPAERLDLPEFEQIKTNIAYLKIPNNNDHIKKYSNTFMNKYEIMKHDNLIKLLQDQETINAKVSSDSANSLDVLTSEYIYNKIKMIKKIESLYNLENLNMESLNNIKTFSKIEPYIYDSICRTFRTNKKNPETVDEFKQFYLTMVKHLTGPNIITSKRCRTDEGERATIYTLNEDYIKYNLDLNKFKNIYCLNFDEKFIKKYNINVTVPPINDSIFLNINDDQFNDDI